MNTYFSNVFQELCKKTKKCQVQLLIKMNNFTKITHVFALSYMQVHKHNSVKQSLLLYINLMFVTGQEKTF